MGKSAWWFFGDFFILALNLKCVTLGVDIHLYILLTSHHCSVWPRGSASSTSSCRFNSSKLPHSFTCHARIMFYTGLSAFIRTSCMSLSLTLSLKLKCYAHILVSAEWRMTGAGNQLPTGNLKKEVKAVSSCQPSCVYKCGCWCICQVCTHQNITTDSCL